MKENKSKICCICGREYDGYGNNPSPVKQTGRCCDTCNFRKVIPARLDLSKFSQNKGDEK